MIPTILALTLAANPAGALVCDAAEVNLGERKCGPLLTHSFTIANPAGNRDPIRIASISPGCGCVRQHVSSHRIPPGETATVTVTVNTLTQAAGPNGWHVTVFSCADPEGGNPSPKFQTLSLTIKANLVREVTVSPPSLAFSTSGGAKQSLTITDRRAKPLTITRAMTTTPHLAARVQPRRTGPQTVEIALAPDSPPGTAEEIVTLLTDDPEYPELRIPVKVSKRDPSELTITPDTVELRFAPGQTDLSALVQIRAGGKPVEIAKVECDSPAIRVKSSPGSGPVATLRVSVSSVPASGPTRADVRVTLAEPAGKTVTIPVSWVSTR